MHAKLLITDTLNQKRRLVTVTAESVTIGSSKEADVCLPNLKSSSLFEIKFSQDEWWVLNLHRDPALKVNGRAVTLEQRLSSHDEIILGDFLIVFEQLSAVSNSKALTFQRISGGDEGLWRHLLEEESFDEILINGAQSIYVDYHGSLIKTSWSFSSNDFLEDKVRKSAPKVPDSLGWFSWRKDRRLRFQATLPPITETPHLAIRKFRRVNFNLAQLEEQDFLSHEAMTLIHTAIKERQNILITGATSTGKTIFLRSLVESLPPSERIVMLEEEAEIDWPHPHVVALECGRGHLRKGLIESLRLRPSRLMVSEVRGAEALEMLQALSTGHSGGLATMHANSSRDAITRLETLVLSADNNLSVSAVRRLIATSINMVIHLSRDHDGKRSVESISRINGMQNETILFSNPLEVESAGIRQREILPSQKKKHSI